MFKLGNRTLQILKNFSTINSEIAFKKGNIIKTSNQMLSVGESEKGNTTIVATAVIQETIDKDFCIHDLPKFLNALGLFSEPVIEIKDKFAIITGDDSKQIQYTFSSMAFPTKLYDGQLVLRSVDCQFEVNSKTLSETFKAMSVLGLNEIVFASDKNVITINALDAEGSTSDTFSSVVGYSNKLFKVYFNRENFKILDDSYKIEICKDGILRLYSNDIEYFMPANTAKTFFED